MLDCARCRHSWLDISGAEQDLAAQTSYVEGYAGYKVDAAFAANARSLLDRYVVDRFMPGARILDVGCGAGAFLKVASDAGYDTQGLDISESAVRLCHSQGCSAVAADYLEWGQTGSFDLITMWDVLEHLHDPLGFLDRTAWLLREGGMLLAKVPTYGRLSIRMGGASPRARQVLLEAPDHVQYYSPRSLDALFARSRLSVERVEQLRQGIRTPPSGGSLKKRAGRMLKRWIAAASGESNILILAGVKRQPS